MISLKTLLLLFIKKHNSMDIKKLKYMLQKLIINYSFDFKCVCAFLLVSMQYT